MQPKQNRYTVLEYHALVPVQFYTYVVFLFMNRVVYLQHDHNYLYGQFFKLKQWQSDYLIAQDADNAGTVIGLMCTAMVQVLTKWQVFVWIYIALACS